MRNAVVLASIALVAGCTSYAWHKEGASELDFERDQFVCAGRSRQPAPIDTESGGPSSYGGSSSYGATPSDPRPAEAALLEKCMAANGWARQELRKD